MDNRIGNLINVDWRKIEPLQPDDVKIDNNKEALKQSLLKNGFVVPFAVWTNNDIHYCIDGHTRKNVLKELFEQGHDVPKTLKAYQIKAKDRQEAVSILVEVFNQKHNPFDSEVLTEWLNIEDVEIEDFEDINIKIPDIGIDSDFKKEAENYSRVVETPIYKPTGKCPKINELFNTDKVQELLKKINEKELPEDIKNFLTFSAYRHTAFNFENIVEYYAHADKIIQELMEDSALVIIDFNKAIEMGYVKMIEKMENQLNLDV